MRTNAHLENDIRAELNFDPRVDDSEIRVTASGDVVTLTGTVPSFADKLAASRAAERVFGVKAIANDLAVAVPVHYEQADTAIAKAVANALEWNVEVPNDSVQGSVSDGWVTLDGTVAWQYQRDAAGRAVSNLAGVRGVTNDLAVSPHNSPADIKRSIVEALERRAVRVAEHVKVETSGSVVTLTGTVPSFGDRRAAEGAAWSAPGVTDVHDDLVVQV
jgi:osmotically-inducible protein OsmY